MNIDDLEKRFKHHPPQDSDQIERYATVRNKLLNLTIELDELTGGLESREKALAVTSMEQSMFWWNAHIARSGVQHKTKFVPAEESGLEEREMFDA